MVDATESGKRLYFFTFHTNHKSYCISPFLCFSLFLYLSLSLRNSLPYYSFTLHRPDWHFSSFVKFVPSHLSTFFLDIVAGMEPKSSHTSCCILTSLSFRSVLALVLVFVSLSSFSPLTALLLFYPSLLLTFFHFHFPFTFFCTFQII